MLKLFQGLLVSVLICVAKGKTIVDGKNTNLKLHLPPPTVNSYKAHGPGVLSDTENLVGDVDYGPEVVRDRRDSTPGFVSYGFGVFGGYRSGYGWRRGDRDRRDRGQTGDGSGGAGGLKSSTTDGLAGWWKMEDNPVGQYKGS